MTNHTDCFGTAAVAVCPKKRPASDRNDVPLEQFSKLQHSRYYHRQFEGDYGVEPGLGMPKNTSPTGKHRWLLPFISPPIFVPSCCYKTQMIRAFGKWRVRSFSEHILPTNTQSCRCWEDRRSKRRGAHLAAWSIGAARVLGSKRGAAIRVRARAPHTRSTLGFLIKGHGQIWSESLSASALLCPPLDWSPAACCVSSLILIVIQKSRTHSVWRKAKLRN